MNGRTGTQIDCDIQKIRQSFSHLTTAPKVKQEGITAITMLIKTSRNYKSL